MSFTSSTFLVFFAVVFSIYWLVRKRAPQNIILLVASYFFYGWINPFYCLLLLFSTVTDYVFALRLIRSTQHKKAILVVSICINVAVLAFFKYVNFFIPSVVNWLTQTGIAADAGVIQILLPAGLSFYTLKKISYMVDVYRGTAEPVHNFIDFALYLSFFPQIISGPIERSQKLLPQIQQERHWKGENLYSAWPLIVMGLFKKIVIANTVKIVVDKIFMLVLPSKTLLLVGTLGFTLEILADFSAYTDLSRGVAYLLGFETSENFRSPYLATSPAEFWNRWHITLSEWLRDYIFFPLRRAMLKQRTQLSETFAKIVPPMVTMLVSGMWHGANWTYLIWGAYHGTLLVLYQLAGEKRSNKDKKKTSGFFAWLLMFVLIVVGWSIFRAPSVPWLMNAIFHSPLFGSTAQAAVSLAYGSVVIFFAVLLILKLLIDRYTKKWPVVETVFLVAASLLVIVFIQPATADFIYVQF